MKGAMKTNRFAVIRTGPDGAMSVRRIYVNRELIQFVKLGNTTMSLNFLGGSLVLTRDVWNEKTYESYQPDKVQS